MRIAFVSYEYPPDTADGGIATYARQAATMLARRGHRVTVFTAVKPSQPSRHESLDGVEVFRVPTTNRYEFARQVEPAFSREQRREPFDVLEAPDFMADGRVIADHHPTLPLVLKLHTCSRILREVGKEIPVSSYAKGWVKAGLTLTKPWWMRLPMERIELEHGQRADVVAAPSRSVGERTRDLWRLPQPPVVLPNPFEVDKRFLSVPIDTATRRVVFVGRLEARKGVFELARAIRQVQSSHPDWQFRFVGKTSEPLRSRVLELAGPGASLIEFFGKVPHERLPDILSDADICVIPSRWENFPTVCLEAMAAARGIVGSRFGGMSEMLEDGRHGLLVDPSQPRTITEALNRLIENPRERTAMGEAARQRVKQLYNAETVMCRQEEVYQMAIDRRGAASQDLLDDRVSSVGVSCVA